MTNEMALMKTIINTMIDSPNQTDDNIEGVIVSSWWLLTHYCYYYCYLLLLLDLIIDIDVDIWLSQWCIIDCIEPVRTLMGPDRTVFVDDWWLDCYCGRMTSCIDCDRTLLWMTLTSIVGIVIVVIVPCVQYWPLSMVWPSVMIWQLCYWHWLLCDD